MSNNSIKVKDIITSLEQTAPLAYQESYDNAGLLTGNPGWDLTGVLVSLDCTEDVVEEAVSRKCNMIVAHHPIIFSGIKKLTGKNYVERTVIKAIKNDIAIYAIHTNLDNVHNGVNKKIADKLGLKNTRVLLPKPSVVKKLVTYVPTASLDTVRNAVFEAGAGEIGNYDQCGFIAEGTGSFRAGEQATPYVGKKNEVHQEPETKFETIFPSHLQSQVISALIHAHPYEEPAYDIYALENLHSRVGSGMVGELENALSPAAFLGLLKRTMSPGCIRYTETSEKLIKKVAVCGGAGSFLLKNAIAGGAQAFVTADFKYHEFFDAEKRLMIADIGHLSSTLGS